MKYRYQEWAEVNQMSSRLLTSSITFCEISLRTTRVSGTVYRQNVGRQRRAKTTAYWATNPSEIWRKALTVTFHHRVYTGTTKNHDHKPTNTNSKRHSSNIDSVQNHPPPHHHQRLNSSDNKGKPAQTNNNSPVGEAKCPEGSGTGEGR